MGLYFNKGIFKYTVKVFLTINKSPFHITWNTSAPELTLQHISAVVLHYSP